MTDNPVTVLAIDDQPVNLRLLDAVLTPRGHRVLTAPSGAEGLALLETHEVDLVLLDIVMPEMDGIELAQKAGEMCPDLRVMFITGFAAVTLKAGKAMPQARVLSKPFHLRDLVAEVDRMFAVDNVTGVH